MPDHTLTQQQSQEISFGYCQCGCGQLAPISDRNDPRRGYVKGTPMRYISHHQPRGRRKYASLADRLWADCAQGEPDECWEWRGAKNPFGHGQLRYRYVQLYAHRASWLVHFGDIPANMCVCHRCDNPSCCNPNHLFLGTHGDNHADMDDKGRGVTNLTAEDIRRIRDKAANGETHAAIGAEFAVHRATIWKIVKGKTWRRVR